MAMHLLRLWLCLLYVLEGTQEALKWLVGHKRHLRRERLRHYGALVMFLLKV